jgi:hypothetical protein
MNRLTMEVEIEHGQIVPSEPAKLPENGSGYLTIYDSTLPEAGLRATPRTEPRPIGLAKGEFTVPDDFNVPLPDDILRAFDGK